MFKIISSSARNFGTEFHFVWIVCPLALLSYKNRGFAFHSYGKTTADIWVTFRLISFQSESYFLLTLPRAQRQWHPAACHWRTCPVTVKRTEIHEKRLTVADKSTLERNPACLSGPCRWKEKTLLPQKLKELSLSDPQKNRSIVADFRTYKEMMRFFRENESDAEKVRSEGGDREIHWSWGRGGDSTGSREW